MIHILEYAWNRINFCLYHLGSNSKQLIELDEDYISLRPLYKDVCHFSLRQFPGMFSKTSKSNLKSIWYLA